MCFKEFIPLGTHSNPILSCADLSEDVNGVVNVTVSWTLSGGDSADSYIISITTNAPQTPYDGLLNITTASVTQYELTGFMAGYEYNITVSGVIVRPGDEEWSESKPLTIRPQGKHMFTLHVIHTFLWYYLELSKLSYKILLAVHLALHTLKLLALTMFVVWLNYNY